MVRVTQHTSLFKMASSYTHALLAHAHYITGPQCTYNNYYYYYYYYYYYVPGK